ncbi:CHAT domain-containing protein [Lactarius quietus]|nr:CHAT domain-containing protein [Lactarius quietus]
MIQNSLSLYPRSHSTHIEYVHILAEMRWVHYVLSREKEDLDEFIVYCTEAIFLSPIPQEGRMFTNIAQLRFHLAVAFLELSKVFEQLEGVRYSIEYLRYLRGFPLDSFGVSRKQVTTSLILALGIQVESTDRDETRSIKEMVVLCCELLRVTSELSTAFPTGAFKSLSEATTAAQYLHGISIDLLDAVIECLRDALKVCPPGSYILVSFVLAVQLGNRFAKTHSLHDYEEAMPLVENVLDPNQPGGCPDSIRGQAFVLATQLAFRRSSVFNNPEYPEVAISHLRASLSSESFVDERTRIHLTEIFSTLATRRFRDYGITESLEEAKSDISPEVDLLSSGSLVSSERSLDGIENRVEFTPGTYSTPTLHQIIQQLEELLSNTQPGTKRYQTYLYSLSNCYKSKFDRTNDVSDIDESIKNLRLSLDATHASDQSRVTLLCSLRNVLLIAYGKSRNLCYLDQSMTVGYGILELKSAQHVHFDATAKLVISLVARGQLLPSWRIEALREAIRLIPAVINDQYARELDRFDLACWWAVLARAKSHRTTLTAYKTAMSLMQRFLSSAPTVSVQHTRLVTTGEDCWTMPLQYASYQIDLGRFEEAVETLEQGRALLWSEMRGLRTAVVRLIKEDSPLAKRFVEINKELEAMTISVTPSGRPEIEDGDAQGRDRLDLFGRLVIKRKKLAEERDALISQIQSRPGWEEFLKAPSFTTLHSAASRGPIIIINHCHWRSDIVIILNKAPLPCCIPTDDDFYDRAKKLRDELVTARKHGLDSKEYQNALCSVLSGLYKLVGEPVIKNLRLLGVPEQSRIWWCPTSVFCSLPLHAMGPIPSSDIRKRYFSDLYIPSYTPSFSALIESRNGSPRVLESPSLLLVAQPDDSLAGVKGEIKVISKRALKAGVTVTGLVSSEATPSSALEGLRGNRLAHFACHGVLETGKPFDASFKLHGGSRLTLLDIVQSRLPDAEFAFLSCCRAAEMTEESVADEALHLTAAMQYCGFRSVVGTMWEMADTDGKDLAKNFYESLFSSQESGLPYYERSAGALRDATKKLREKRGITLERWVNFVHYGARGCVFE